MTLNAENLLMCNKCESTQIEFVAQTVIGTEYRCESCGHHYVIVPEPDYGAAQPTLDFTVDQISDTK